MLLTTRGPNVKIKDLPSSSNDRLFPPDGILDEPPEGAPILAASYKFKDKLLVSKKGIETNL